MLLSRNIETLNNRAKAINEVNSFINKTAFKCQSVFNDLGESIYKQDGTLNKKTRDQLKVILTGHNLHAVFIDDSHNSIKILYRQRYAVQNGCSYYDKAVFIICKFENWNSDRAKCNVKIPLEPACKKITGKQLLDKTSQAYKLETKIRDLQYQLSDLKTELQD
jgi:polyhydroxyalkanoate synthesis regulator phasin